MQHRLDKLDSVVRFSLIVAASAIGGVFFFQAAMLLYFFLALEFGWH